MPHEYPAIAQDDDDALTYTGSYPVNQEHQLEGLLEMALQKFQQTAQQIAVSFIQDARTRQEYMRQIEEIPKVVRAELSSGRVGLPEAVRFAQTIRNQIMKEARAATSATGLALAERHKKEGLTERYLLERYSAIQNVPGVKEMRPPEQKAYIQSIVDGRTPSVFDRLNQQQRARVFYSIIDASGRDSVDFTNFALKYAAIGKVFTAMTAILAVYSVATSKDKAYETNRQASAIGGSLLGGALAGMTVGSICGPGAPICAFAVVAAGSLAGAVTMEKANELYQAELQEFMKWQIR
ncbi:hypothetical protein [Burkholderia ubonensis]|uniref:hypothetical protein n=1 Tax=Burkholderia ubonensis TaxID=101571 RepID=UPI000BA6E2D9|nr:hypothetical protein [Burkholderia ubonensis]PAK13858.1 hypothetical protein CJO66_12805 [Burkholderia ubonensis]RQP38515.1 hypothetical protein DF156_19245 [Burkholderia ubonensis]RQP39515.1 hypothetical protein DF155_06910 [Burkholderia ubonensis]RQP39814.1 hypothetical protein DF154_14685 [Burkholderia ubonensis]RQP52901.1 hypothetical protein DF144_17940 [Burkholderia ubonensis]